VKIQIMDGKVCLKCKGKTLLEFAGSVNLFFRFAGNSRGGGQYHRVQAEDGDDQADEPAVTLADETESQESQDESSSTRLLRSLSSPSFVPANIPESGKSSGTEESDVDGIRGAAASSRRVRFQRLAEV
jgi:hypothetical protein